MSSDQEDRHMREDQDKYLCIPLYIGRLWSPEEEGIILSIIIFLASFLEYIIAAMN